MEKRGPKPKNIIPTTWSPELAYAIGLLVSDGCLSNDGRHIDFTSKDLEQIEHFKKCLNLSVKIGTKSRGFSNDRYYRIQFGNVIFYKFLESIGLTSAKSKTIGTITVPDEYFWDYLRGYFDGDGSFYSYWDKRWKSSHMFYVSFACASLAHVNWLCENLIRMAGVIGHVDSSHEGKMFQLRYVKKEALEIISKMYYSTGVISLSRKRLKIQEAIRIENEQQAKY